MLIRKVTTDDKSDLLEWRNHPDTRAMFFDQNIVPEDVHEHWFKSVLNSDDQTLFIGHDGVHKIGMVRFDKNANQTATISVNVNPTHRGTGQSKLLLGNAILAFINEYSGTLLAQVKSDNPASLKLFRGLGFLEKTTEDDVTTFALDYKPIHLSPVSMDDAQALYNLLKTRKHNISHQDMPSFEDHCSFMDNHPYRDWFIIRRDGILGSVYTQDDNSIGLNLSEPKILDVLSILNYIRTTLTPVAAQPSKIPNYFYFNVAASNHDVQRILEDLKLEPLQVAFRI